LAAHPLRRVAAEGAAPLNLRALDPRRILPPAVAAGLPPVTVAASAAAALGAASAADLQAEHLRPARLGLGSRPAGHARCAAR
jgi:hypothetical protein